jgi:hypothetical protein
MMRFISIAAAIPKTCGAIDRNPTPINASPRPRANLRRS